MAGHRNFRELSEPINSDPERRKEIEKLKQEMGEEERATYERIRDLREEIGPLDFDVAEELRKLREEG